MSKFENGKDGIYRQANDPDPSKPPLFVIDLTDPRQTGGDVNWLYQKQKPKAQDKRDVLGKAGRALNKKK